MHRIKKRVLSSACWQRNSEAFIIITPSQWLHTTNLGRTNTHISLRKSLLWLLCDAGEYNYHDEHLNLLGQLCVEKVPIWTCEFGKIIIFKTTRPCILLQYAVALSKRSSYSWMSFLMYLNLLFLAVGLLKYSRCVYWCEENNYLNSCECNTPN